MAVEEVSFDASYARFLERLASTVDGQGRPAPRYAAYDVEYDLGEEGKRIKSIFISWVPFNTPVKVSTMADTCCQD